MRFFAKSLLAILLAAAVAGALTFPAWWLINHVAEIRPDRVLRRLGLLTLAISLYLLLRREGLLNRAVLGYGIPRPQFLRQLAIGFGCGLILMMPLMAGLFALD